MNGYREEVQNVLVAEDDDDDFDVFAEAVKDLSLDIVLERAPNGDILMKILDEKIPDLLFMDILMPCKDGKDCVFEIRSNKKFDHLPIIVFSSVRDEHSIEFFYRQGTNLYVFKPHSYKELLDALRKIFSIDWKRVRYFPTRADFTLNAREA